MSEEEAWHVPGYKPAPSRHHAYSSEGELAPKGQIVQKHKKTKLRAPTSFGQRMLQAVPPDGIEEHDLIEKLGGLAAYANYQQGIEELVRTGYLTQDSTTKRYKRA